MADKMKDKTRCFHRSWSSPRNTSAVTSWIQRFWRSKLAGTTWDFRGVHGPRAQFAIRKGFKRLIPPQNWRWWRLLKIIEVRSLQTSSLLFTSRTVSSKWSFLGPSVTFSRATFALTNLYTMNGTWAGFLNKINCGNTYHCGKHRKPSKTLPISALCMELLLKRKARFFEGSSNSRKIHLWPEHSPNMHIKPKRVSLVELLARLLWMSLKDGAPHSPLPDMQFNII